MLTHFEHRVEGVSALMAEVIAPHHEHVWSLIRLCLIGDVVEPHLSLVSRWLLLSSFVVLLRDETGWRVVIVESVGEDLPIIVTATKSSILRAPYKL